MKRTAEQAFASQNATMLGSAAMAPPQPGGPPMFQPNGQAFLDPKAYFMQWQSHAAANPQAAPVAPAAGAPAKKVTEDPPEVLVRLSKEDVIAQEKQLAARATKEGATDATAKILWKFAKADVIGQYKNLITKVVKEMVADGGRRVGVLSHESLVQLLWAVARGRRHIRKGDHIMIHMDANDELLFQLASKRILEELDQIDVRILAEHVHTHAEVGIKDVKLFKAICPKLLAKQKQLDEKIMGKAIKAYAKFMLPLTEDAQGFRTLAVVAKGDFIRPSDKPAKVGPKQYDHPQALFPKPQLHSRS